MTMAVTLSTGPVLRPGIEKAVHIIFVPPDVEAPSDATEEERVSVATTVGPVQETDVIVFRGRPWHVVKGRLEKHPDVHTLSPATILDISVDRREQVVWWSEQPFKITGITGHHSVDDPTPFANPLTGPERPAGGPAEDIHVARSSAPSVLSKGHEYKISFQRGDRVIDPNMRCS
jgi:hypothetical protein